MNIFKEYLLSVVLRLTLVLILTGGVVFYTSRQIAVNSEAVRTKRTLIAVWDQKAESLTRLQADYKIIEPNLPVLESALPKADDLFVYFNKLDKLAEKNGLAAQLAIGQQITSAEGGEPAGMVFRATIDGTLPNFLNYLKEAEKLPHFVKFSEIALVGLQGLYNPSRINYSGKIYTAP
ncbi:hypothetical protein A3J02_00895 [Candidatus Azambacteria bacterium RIFCSPLOWO2_02_FULL_46_11]|uniref:Uncharacterized protein n=2 Tax=Candidatus Azamiibacteriota TaxID=1752741 RepID=A0A1F5C6B5_9BACT|nr:MAG: hypothetical protein A3A25_01280 [Candidatus Azambacteria bacterium RIFCSPLOWO2_01_FULL_46_26]OGD45247.1 MAG: hypothetical protein A3J02_00895 [Candidatus Azambacteria bacterium RIFCSPLOWO2_02_FULL_46_11]